MLESDTIYGFFDGAEHARNCGTGMTLRIDDSHSFKQRMGVGSGTNTFFEILALCRILWFTKKRNILELSIFRNSKVVINSARSGLTNL